MIMLKGFIGIYKNMKIFKVLLYSYLAAFFSSGCGNSHKDAANEASKQIKLKHIANFLSDEECDHIINLSHDHFSRSPVLIESVSNISPSRTSYTYFLGKSIDQVVQEIEKRAATYMGNTINHLESLQVVRYLPGQQFKEHHDWFNNEYLEKTNTSQRRYTMFVYLNDVVQGGETYFSYFALKIKPKKGHAIFWENCTKPHECHNESLHAGLPPLEGIKYGLNIWSRFETN